MRDRTEAAERTNDVSAADARAEAAGGSSAAPAASAAPEIAGSQDVEFTLCVDVTYHRARQAFLAGLHRWTMFGVIVAGVSAVSPLAPALCGLAAAALGAADIAFDFVGRAQAHADAARRYLDLVSRFADGEPPEGVRRAWLAISADEPATYRLAYLIAHNQTVASLGRGDAVALTLGQRLRAHVLRS